MLHFDFHFIRPRSDHCLAFAIVTHSLREAPFLKCVVSMGIARKGGGVKACQDATIGSESYLFSSLNVGDIV